MNIKYFIKEGFKNTWTNGVMSAASVLVMVCCMILTGGAMLLSLNLNHTLKGVENSNTMVVFLKKGVSPDQVIDAGNQIKNTPNILKCDYYSSEQASEKYKDVLGDLYEVVKEGENPFPEAYHITMKDLSLYKKTIDKIRSIENVESVGDRSETAKKLSDLNKIVAQAGIWIICSLGVVSLFIISNTIKITMHNRRFEISIMKSVGATNGFIKAPFMVEGMVIGCIAAVISTLVLKVVYDGLLSVIGGIVPFSGISFEDVMWIVLGCFLATGVLFGVIGSSISLRRYLSKEGGEVVAW